MKTWAILISVLSAFLPSQGTKNPSQHLPALPGASLLVGYPPESLQVTNPHEDMRLQPEEQPETRGGTVIYPSISRDGKVVAYGRVKAGAPERIISISTYSAKTDKHTDYAQGEFGGAIAISPDASKLAYSANQLWTKGGDNHLHIIDLKTGQLTLGPEVRTLPPTFASWSPDSRRLAYSIDGEIRVWDAETGKVSKIADGDLPAWSPSGEWIAFLQGVPDKTLSSAMRTPTVVPGRWLPKVLVVHPDGTGGKILIELPDKKNFPRFLMEAPVWSPDSKTILLNELDNVDAGTMKIHLFDLKTLTLRTVFKDSVPVLGWAEAN